MIIGHEIPEGNLRKVSYENGTVIYVNYGQNDLEADGFLVRGKGYTSVRSGVVLAQGTAAEGEGGGY